MVANAAKSFGHKDVIYEPDKTKIPALLKKVVKKDDIVITMGAGDIWKYGEKFVDELNKGKKLEEIISNIKIVNLCCRNRFGYLLCR